MLVLVAVLAIHVFGNVDAIPVGPENITVTFLTPKSVRVSWQIAVNQKSGPIEKYEISYKPSVQSVIIEKPGHSEAVILDHLNADTEYQVNITALWRGKKYRSRPIKFRTLEAQVRGKPSSNEMSSHEVNGEHADFGGGAGAGATGQIPPFMDKDETPYNTFTDEYGPLSENGTARELPPIRGIEIGIVVLVLIVWAGAIALFFNRWGKIRMLLPYQPDYKQEQLKVPGTGVCAAGTCNGQHSHQHVHHWTEKPAVSTEIADRCTRSRINSAIFVSSEGQGFDSIEFLRRYGSQSVLCRKARSAENIGPDRNISSLDKQDSENDGCDGDAGYNDNVAPVEIIELAECHEPCSSKMTPKMKPELTYLPTLSVSGPSPPLEEELF